MAKILIVEDNENHRTILTRRLESRGFDVVIAIDGEDGLAMAQAEQPDLILMDMRLPQLDGWEAARKLKVMEATRDIPIIAITAYRMDGDREKALEAGCEGFIPKPVEIADLLAQMEGLLGLSVRNNNNL